MKEETEQVRVYKSDYKWLRKRSKTDDTTMARIIHELIGNEKEMLSITE